MKKQHSIGVFIGRMNPPHKGHIETIKRMIRENDLYVVILGSANQYPTIKNPFSWKDRLQMLVTQMEEDFEEYPYMLVIDHIEDQPSDNAWAMEVQKIVSRNIMYDDCEVKLYGHMKDESSYYLKMFPNWSLVETGNYGGLNSTDIRNQMFGGSEHNVLWWDKVTPPVREYIEKWKIQKPFLNDLTVNNLDYFRKEYAFIQNYKKSWEAAPYAPTFVTVDACVVCSGHILLVKRKAEPCAGAWALPGGFVNQNELLIDACIRELREETKIKVPAPVLRGSIKASQVFDNPTRSLRGRTITHAYYIELPLGELPKVKGSDSFWMPLNEVNSNKHKLFEDHYQIISALALSN